MNANKMTINIKKESKMAYTTAITIVIRKV